MNITGRIKLQKLKSELLAIFLFIISSIFSLYLALNLYDVPSIKGESSSINIFFVFYYIGFIVLFTIIILFLVKKHARLIKSIFTIIVIYMVFVVSSIISGIISVNVFEYYSIIGIVTAFFAYMVIFKNEWYITDTVGIIMISGAAAIIGILLKPYIAMVLLIVFAVYDYISVYKTKHMVTLAKAAVDNSFPLMFALPNSRGMKLKELTFDNRGESNVLMLGFGDMAIPEILIVSSSIFYINYILIFAVFTIGGAIIALYLLFLTNRNKPAPGLPYINTGVIIGFLIAFLIIYLH